MAFCQRLYGRGRYRDDMGNAERGESQEASVPNIIAPIAPGWPWFAAGWLVGAMFVLLFVWAWIRS